MELHGFVVGAFFQKIGQSGVPDDGKPPRSISFDESSRMSSCFENPRLNKKQRNQPRVRAGAGPAPRPTCTPTGRPCHRAHLNLACFVLSHGFSKRNLCVGTRTFATATAWVHRGRFKVASITILCSQSPVCAEAHSCREIGRALQFRYCDVSLQL